MSGPPRTPNGNHILIRPQSRIDLHTHTTASDGTLPPEAVLQKAMDSHVSVLSITDHETTAGYSRVAQEASQRMDFRLIPGIEMSAEGEFHCHLLGYGIRVDDARFQRRLEEFRALRVGRIQAMVDRLRTLGVSITFDDVLKKSAGGALGRPHIADALIDKKVVRKRQEAFDRFLKRDAPAFVETKEPSAETILEVIREAGGISVLAHPSHQTTEQFIRKLVEWGLMGIEAYYSDHSRALIQRYQDLAKKYDLVTTGGSDFHGPRTGRPRLGSVDVPHEALEALLARLREKS